MSSLPFVNKGLFVLAPEYWIGKYHAKSALNKIKQPARRSLRAGCGIREAAHQVIENRSPKGSGRHDADGIAPRALARAAAQRADFNRVQFARRRGCERHAARAGECGTERTIGGGSGELLGGYMV